MPNRRKFILAIVSYDLFRRDLLVVDVLSDVCVQDGRKKRTAVDDCDGCADMKNVGFGSKQTECFLCSKFNLLLKKPMKGTDNGRIAKV
jgi:hypothetical protein